MRCTLEKGFRKKLTESVLIDKKDSDPLQTKTVAVKSEK